MRDFLKFFTSFLFLCNTAHSQERGLLFNTTALSHPVNYAATQITFTPEKYNGTPIWQLEFGWLRPLKGELWHTEFLISYRQTSAQLSGPGKALYEQPKTSPYYISGQIETSNKLYMPGAKFGVSKKWELGTGSSALWLTIGVQEHALFFSSKTDVVPYNVHSKAYHTEDSFGFKQLIFGFYSRPMYEFDLGDTDDSWKFLVYTEFNLMQHKRSFKDASIACGGGLGVRYKL